MTLFVEVMDLAVLSVSAFAVTDARRVAKRQLNVHQANNSSSSNLMSQEDCEELLTLPLASHKFFDLWDKNSSILEQSTLGNFASLYPHKSINSRDFVKAIVNPYAAALEEESSAASYSWSQAIQNRQIHCVGDVNQHSACVYMICSDDNVKRIALAFRGSITPKDWMQDFQFSMSSIHNPLLKELEAKTKTVGIHLGFRDYLYGRTSTVSNSESPKQSGSSLPTPMQLVSALPKLPVPTLVATTVTGEATTPATVQKPKEEEELEDLRNSIASNNKEPSKLETILRLCANAE